MFLVLAVTALLCDGGRGTAQANTVMVSIKTGMVQLFIALAAGHFAYGRRHSRLPHGQVVDPESQLG